MTLDLGPHRHKYYSEGVTRKLMRDLGFRDSCLTRSAKHLPSDTSLDRIPIIKDDMGGAGRVCKLLVDIRCRSGISEAFFLNLALLSEGLALEFEAPDDPEAWWSFERSYPDLCSAERDGKVIFGQLRKYCTSAVSPIRSCAWGVYQPDDTGVQPPLHAAVPTVDDPT